MIHAYLGAASKELLLSSPQCVCTVVLFDFLNFSINPNNGFDYHTHR